MKQFLPLLLLVAVASASFAQDQNAMQKNTRNGRVTDQSKGLSLVIRGGWSYRTAKAHPDLSKEQSEHYKSLRSGLHIGGDAAYYISEYIGIGLKYTLSRFQNPSHDGRHDNIILNYIGPSVYGRYLFAQQKLQFVYGLSLGYLHYQDRTVYQMQALKITGNTFGTVLDLGLHLKLTDHLLIGLEPSYMSGILNTIETTNGPQTVVTELEGDERENLSAFHVALKATWNF